MSQSWRSPMITCGPRETAESWPSRSSLGSGQLEPQGRMRGPSQPRGSQGCGWPAAWARDGPVGCREPWNHVRVADDSVAGRLQPQPTAPHQPQGQGRILTLLGRGDWGQGEGCFRHPIKFHSKMLITYKEPPSTNDTSASPWIRGAHSQDGTWGLCLRPCCLLADGPSSAPQPFLRGWSQWFLTLGSASQPLQVPSCLDAQCLYSRPLSQELCRVVASPGNTSPFSAPL